MRSIFKAFAAGAIVVPIVLGGAGTALAGGHDDGGPAYQNARNSAGVAGGSSSKTFSGFGPDGVAYFGTASKVAGPTGATGSGTGSHS